jgi:hypothetical protein
MRLLSGSFRGVVMWQISGDNSGMIALACRCFRAGWRYSAIVWLETFSFRRSFPHLFGHAVPSVRPWPNVRKRGRRRDRRDGGLRANARRPTDTIFPPAGTKAYTTPPQRWLWRPRRHCRQLYSAVGGASLGAARITRRLSDSKTVWSGVS